MARMIPKDMKRNWQREGCGPGRRGYHHGGLKDALVEAARALMAEHGPAGFTLAEAAKRVGVTNAAPYRHFADRSDLMGELARRGFDLFAERLAGAWDEGRPDAYAALRRMGRAYLGFAAAEPGLYAAMFDSAKNLRGAAAFAVASKAFEGLSRAAAGVLAAAGGNPREARRLALEIWALAHGTAMLALGGHLDAGRGDDPAVILDKGAEGLIEAALRRK
jgi:AcrR family transcriptional regulator